MATVVDITADCAADKRVFVRITQHNGDTVEEYLVNAQNEVYNLTDETLTVGESNPPVPGAAR